MQDFIRIGGPIISSPLNENFRRLANAVSLANVNLIFPEENGTVNTMTDMYNIENPQDAQVCYVISSGELYRYSAKDYDWHKIMDIGETFRQGFLNSGAVVLEGPITLKENTTSILEIPAMLVYFKNKPGDDRYLKGMYKIDATEFDIDQYISSGNAYSIRVDYQGEFSVITGLPTQDDVDHIYIGTVLVDGNGHVLRDCVYTLPDMAFTADRGNFMLNGGQASGLNLVSTNNGDATVARREGYYYDEGINYPQGQTADYPADTDNGSNFDLLHIDAQDPLEGLIYIAPENGLNNEITYSTELIADKWWNNGSLDDVPEGNFTIQQHLVTPNGQSFMVLGNTLYSSMTDAIANINNTYGLDISFPYVEATRVVLGKLEGEDFDSGDTRMCQFFTMGRLAQVGTIRPQFADNQFEIYSGLLGDLDNNPARIRFDLQELEKAGYNTLISLDVLPLDQSRELFFSGNKYIKDGEIDTVISNWHQSRSYYPGSGRTKEMPEASSDNLGEILQYTGTDSEDYMFGFYYQCQEDGNGGYEWNQVWNDMIGYQIADENDIYDLMDRVNAIEKEIWDIDRGDIPLYNQSIRYRLYQDETQLNDHTTRITQNETNIDNLFKNKVNKTTTINGYTLGDTQTASEAKTITLQTGDIAEGNGRGASTNLWYTDARVSANTDVVAAKTHADTISANDAATSHTVVNPHNISTDDIKLLNNTTKVFMTPTEKDKVANVPANTNSELAALDTNKLSNIPVTKLGGSVANPDSSRDAALGNFKSFAIYEDGVTFSTNGNTLVMNMRGQRDGLMEQNRYATIEAEYPGLFDGYVDKAVNADYASHINGADSATASQYYGTDDNTTLGFHDLPVYVSTVDQSSFASADQIQIVPVDGSVTENSLALALSAKINNNYHSVYDSGTLSSNEINTFKFGNNLTVSVNGHEATINATGSGSGSVSEFANLNDVDVVYSGNEGKMLVVNSTGNGITLSTAPALNDYMRRSIYVSSSDITKIKKAEVADTALLANVASNASAVNSRIVDDTDNTTDSLWTASKIISYVSDSIANDGVNTYYGTSAPTTVTGSKDGDIYILIES